MKFGVRDDPFFGGVLDSILFLDGEDDSLDSQPNNEPEEYSKFYINKIAHESPRTASSSRCSSTLLDITMTDTFASELSTLHDIDEQVQNILQGHESIPQNPASEGIIVAFVNSLSDHIKSLRNEITFLRAESLVKNGTIGKLMSELSKYKHVPCDTSADLEAIMANLSLYTDNSNNSTRNYNHNNNSNNNKNSRGYYN